MSTLDPAVRDLLAAACDTLDAIEDPTAPVFAVQTVLRGLVEQSRTASTIGRTAYLRETFAELADARRVRNADRLALALEVRS